MWNSVVDLGWWSILARGLVSISAVIAAVDCWADGSIDDRLNRASHRVESDPSDPQAFWQRAELWREHGDFDAALADLERAAQLDPGNALTAILEARVHLQAGQAMTVVDVLHPFLGKNEVPAEAHRLNAEALLQLHWPARAATSFSRAIARHPAPSPSLYLSRARAWLAAGPENRERSLQGLDEGMRRLGPIASLLREAIEIEVTAGNFESALERISSAMTKAHRKEVWLEWRGRILDEAGRGEEAREAYVHAQRELARAPASQRSSPAMRALEERLHTTLAARQSDGASTSR